MTTFGFHPRGVWCGDTKLSRSEGGDVATLTGLPDPVLLGSRPEG